MKCALWIILSLRLVFYFFTRWAEKFDSLSETAIKDPEGFLGHPVNAYKLMKRLNTEWLQLENLVLKDMSDGKDLNQL